MKNIFIIFLLLIATCLSGQVRQTNTPSGNTPKTDEGKTDKPKTGQIQEQPTGPDTSIYDFVYFDELDKKYVYQDTLLDRIDRYNTAFNKGDEHFTLGNLGSSSIPVRYETQKKIGINYGYNQYDLYNFTLDSIKLFKLNRPFNDLFFSPLQGQANFLVKARFARQFSDGISLHFNYQRINQDGFYQNQFAQTTNLSSSILLEKERYTGLYTLLVNNNNEDHNGGITTDTFYNYSFYNYRSRVENKLLDADTRKSQRIFAIDNLYNLKSGKDSSFDLHHQLIWEKGAFRSSDETVSTIADSTFYKQFWVDPRGLRNQFTNSSLTNSFDLRIKKSELIKFQSGIKWKRNKISYAEKDSTFSELSLFGKLNSRIKSIDLSLFGELGLAQLAGDFNLDGSISYRNKLFNIKTGIHLYRMSPSLKSEFLVINEVQFWQNDFVKPVGTELFASLFVPKANLKLSLRQIVENNSIYWDSSHLPQQLKDVLSITQLSASHKLRLGPVGLDHDLLYQLNSSDLLSLPNFLVNQRLYFQFRIFEKKLEIQAGGEINYLSNFNAYSYLPLTGTFGNTEDAIENYPMLNAFINIKVSKFRFFCRFDNFNSLWRNLPYYQVKDHPMFDYNFRLGVRWILAD